MLNPKIKKFIKIILGLLFLMVILLLLVLFQSRRPQDLEVIFLDIKAGDSIFIKTPDHQKILIDGGMDKSVLNKLGENFSFWDRKIDLMILTHPHLDHVTGLVDVLKHYKVKQIFYNGVSFSEPTYSEWLKIIKEKNIPIQIVTTGQKTELGKDLKLITLWPSQDFLHLNFCKECGTKSNLNDSSLVNKLIYKNTSFLFAGDLEWKGEEKILSQLNDICGKLYMSNIDNLSGPASPKRGESTRIVPHLLEKGAGRKNAELECLRADVLKVGHHGSISSSTQEFLKAVQPKWAVIFTREDGKNTKVNLPHPRVLKRLERMKIKIFRIDQSGDVRMRSDGEKIIIDTEG